MKQASKSIGFIYGIYLHLVSEFSYIKRNKFSWHFAKKSFKTRTAANSKMKLNLECAFAFVELVYTCTIHQIAHSYFVCVCIRLLVQAFLQTVSVECIAVGWLS